VVRTPHLRRSRASAVVFFIAVALGGDVGGGRGSTAACIVIEDRQLVVLAAHVTTATMARRLANAQQRGQVTVTKAEAARGQTTINQNVAVKMSKILLRLCYILNINKETAVVETEAVVAAEGAGGSGLRLQRQWQWHQQPTAATAGAGNGGGSRGSTRVDNNQSKSGSNIS